MSNIKIGVGVVIINPEGKALFCKRKSNHGKGLYSIPGGGVEVGEKFEECASREIYEETGIKLNRMTFFKFKFFIEFIDDKILLII